MPYEAVLGQMVTIREDGVERRVTAAEAFLLRMAKSGLDGNGAAGRAALDAIETARSIRNPNGESVHVICVTFVSPGSVVCGLTHLRMATKVDRFRPTIKLLLEPWLVAAALQRLGDHWLNIEEQAEVWRATRTPRKVKLPEWWTLTPELLRAIPHKQWIGIPSTDLNL
jgi:hypothetical protein